MSDETYEIYYYEIQGRPEIARLILEAAGIPYTNRPVKDWKAEKQNTPYGQVPVLIIKTKDGKEIHLAQTQSINRYLAQKAGLLPKDPHAAALNDSVVEAALETYGNVYRWYFIDTQKGTPQRAEARAKLVNEQIPQQLKYINAAIERATQGSAGHVSGNSLTLADIMLFHTVEVFDHFFPGEIDVSKAPAVAKVAAAVREHPKIKAYLASDRRLQNVKVE